MRKGVIVAMVALILVATPVVSLGYNFTASDFQTSVIAKINGNTYSVNKINGTYFVDHICFGHERVTVNYTVTPLVNIVGKSFTVRSNMINPQVTVYCYYHELSTPFKPEIHIIGGNYTTSKIPSGPTDEGPYKVVFVVNGSLPIINRTFKNFTVFNLSIENGYKNCFSPVVVRIINKDKLGSYISYLKSQISKIEGKVNGCKDAENYLNNAKNDINSAYTLYQNEVYDKAYKNAISAENWIKKAEEALNKTTAENIVNKLKTNIDLLNFKIQQIESDLYKVGSKISSTQLAEYLGEKSNLKQKYDQYSKDLNKLQDMLNKKNYTTVITQGKQLMNEVNSSLSDANSLLNTLEGILSPAVNETATTTTTTMASKNPISLSTTTLEIIGDIVAVAIIIIAIIFYMRGRGGFDELS